MDHLWVFDLRAYKSPFSARFFNRRKSLKKPLFFLLVYQKGLCQAIFDDFVGLSVEPAKISLVGVLADVVLVYQKGMAALFLIGSVEAREIHPLDEHRPTAPPALAPFRKHFSHFA